MVFHEVQRRSNMFVILMFLKLRSQTRCGEREGARDRARSSSDALPLFVAQFPIELDFARRPNGSFYSGASGILADPVSA
jgi:hypothetical protein